MKKKKKLQTGTPKVTEDIQPEQVISIPSEDLGEETASFHSDVRFESHSMWNYKTHILFSFQVTLYFDCNGYYLYCYKRYGKYKLINLLDYHCRNRGQQLRQLLCLWLKNQRWDRLDLINNHIWVVVLSNKQVSQNMIYIYTNPYF